MIIRDIAIHIFDVFLHVHVVLKVVGGDGRVDELTHGVPVLIDLSVHILHVYIIILMFTFNFLGIRYDDNFVLTRINF